MTAAELMEIKDRNRYKLGCGRAPTKRELERDIKILLKEIAFLKKLGLAPGDSIQWRECIGGGWIRGVYTENVSELAG